MVHRDADGSYPPCSVSGALEVVTIVRSCGPSKALVRVIHCLASSHGAEVLTSCDRDCMGLTRRPHELHICFAFTTMHMGNR
jgi:hypothetical protein